MQINLNLSGGPFDGTWKTIYHQEAPIELRVAQDAGEGDNTVMVQVYRVYGVEDMPAGIGKAATYIYQGERLSAWSLVDFTV